MPGPGLQTHLVSMNTCLHMHVSVYLQTCSNMYMYIYNYIHIHIPCMYLICYADRWYLYHHTDMCIYIYTYLFCLYLQYTTNDLYIPISWPANLRHHVPVHSGSPTPSFGSWFMTNALSSWDHQPSRSSYRLPHWARGNCLSRYWHCKNTTNRTYRHSDDTVAEGKVSRKVKA